MSGFLTPEELRKLKPAETSASPSPVPTQIVSSDEYFSEPQTPEQQEVEVCWPGVKIAWHQAGSKMSIMRSSSSPIRFPRIGFSPIAHRLSSGVKTAIFSGNNIKLYNFKVPATWSKMDRFSALKEDYLQAGPRRTNLRYSYVPA